MIQRSRLQGTKARDAAGEDTSTLHFVLYLTAERVLDVLQRDDPVDEGRHGLSKQARSAVPRAQGPFSPAVVEWEIDAEARKSVVLDAREQSRALKLFSLTRDERAERTPKPTLCTRTELHPLILKTRREQARFLEQVA